MVATRTKHFLNLTIDEQRYLSGPIIYHAGGWSAGPILPKLIPMARFVMVLSGDKRRATYEETLAYISSASFTAPLHSDHAQIMFWLTQTIWERHHLLFEHGTVWQMLGDKKPVELTPYQHKYILDPLRERIRTAVVRHAREIEKRKSCLGCGEYQ
jgi:hypothetical protein